MKATVYSGRNTVQVENVPDPKILNQHDAIVKISSTAICGSDLHLYDGYMPTARKGDIFGHEFMGEVVETGREVKDLQVGDRVVVPFPIACGQCNQCSSGLFASIENSTPNSRFAEAQIGHSPAGIFGYSHLLGGFAGGQAEYARVPFADVGPLKIDDDLTDEQVLPLSDAFPTGYFGADMCDIEGHDIVAVWGAGPVGLYAAASAWLLGAHRVVVIDRFDYRLEMARNRLNCETINYEQVDSVKEALDDMTGGRGPDKCIDAVGMEGHSAHGLHFAYDRVKQAGRQETERPYALREAITACRPGGTVSVIGVYGGLLDKMPMGTVVNNGLTLRAGQCHVHAYLKPLLNHIREGRIDPSFVFTHKLPLDEVSNGYETFKHKQDECVKVVLKPGA